MILFKISLPRGRLGPRGCPGISGAQGPSGLQGLQGPSGTPGGPGIVCVTGTTTGGSDIVANPNISGAIDIPIGDLPKGYPTIVGATTTISLTGTSGVPILITGTILGVAGRGTSLILISPSPNVPLPVTPVLSGSGTVCVSIPTTNCIPVAGISGTIPEINEDNQTLILLLTLLPGVPLTVGSNVTLAVGGVTVSGVVSSISTSTVTLSGATATGAPLPITLSNSSGTACFTV